MKRKMPKSSWYKMGKVYGGIGLALANPLVGVAFAALMHKLEKSQELLEKDERDAFVKREQQFFRNKFYARQKYATYEDYLLSPRWEEIRSSVVVRARGRCEISGCGLALEEVHHKFYPRVWGTEEIGTLIGLCADHHREEHKHKS